MPSPFPGMDPYLEGELWAGIHSELAIEVKRQLVAKLVPRYYPFIEKYQIKALVADMGLSVALEPDVAVAKTSRKPLTPVLSALIKAPLIMNVPFALPVNQYRVAIRDLAKRRLVTAIEFLSPANKKNPGRKQYLRKRERILASPVHLVEIDLLRRGNRPPMVEPYPAGCYFVIVSRQKMRPVSEVWPITLQQPLPTVPIPLAGKDPDIPLDLQDAFTKVYDLGHYARIIDYHKGPAIRFSAEQEQWAADWLRQTLKK